MSSAASSTSGFSQEKQEQPQKYSNHDDSSVAPFSRTRDVAFIFIVCMAQFMSLAGLSQSVAPMFIIGDTFKVYDAGELSWYAAAYSLTVGTFILPSGRLGDMYGHKTMFLLGWFWFGLWALIAGFSVYSGSILFNVARGFQGIGPAMLVPNAMALIGKTYPMGLKKNLIFSFFGAGGPTGFTLGALFAAIFGQLTWWPWAFWALSIVCAFFLASAYIIIPADEKRSSPAAQANKPKFDYLGAITGVTGLILFNFAWNQGPVVGWQTPYVYVLLIIGVLFIVAFFIVEAWYTEHPLIPIRGLKKEAGFALTCIAAGWGSHGIWFYYIWYFLQRLRGLSPLMTAAQTSPVAVVGTAFALSAGWLMTKTKPSHVMFLAMVFFLVGGLLISTVPVHQSYWIQTFLSIIIMPGGMNLSFPAGTILLSNAIPKENQGIAASLVSTTVNYSVSIGLGFAGTIDRYITPDPSYPDGRNILRGIRGAWWFGTGLNVLGIFVALYSVWTSRPATIDIPFLKTLSLRNENSIEHRSLQHHPQSNTTVGSDVPSEETKAKSVASAPEEV